jgi:hypothetical protein
MKKLLLSLFFIVSLPSYSQNDCSTAIAININGITTTPTIAGTYSESCYAGNTDNVGGTLYGVWYSFTPSSSGEVVITSDLPTPANSNTRVSVFTGDCTNLTCYTKDDNISNTNLLSAVTFPVIGGTIYYIQWDSFYSNVGFDFSLNYTPISCLKTYSINPQTNTTSDSVTLNWDASLSIPPTYNVEYGTVGFTQGTGTTSSPSTNTANLTGLAVNTVYDYYVRANCGSSQSIWSSVNKFTTAKTCPQLATFDNATQLTGWTFSGDGNYGIGTTASLAQGGTGQYIKMNNNTATATNNWLFSPAFYLQQGESVTTTFFTRCQTTRALRFTVGTDNTTAAQTTEIWSNNALSSLNYIQNTTPAWVAPAAGIYYFAFNDVSAVTTTASTLRIDTVNFTSVLSNNDYISSKILVYPNPVKDFITILNDSNRIIKNVEISDINGRTIISTKSISQSQINIADLSSGVYFLKITTDGGNATKKIIKE